MSSLYSFYKNTPGLQVKRDMDFSNVTIQCDPRLVVPDTPTTQTSGIFKKDTAGKIAVEHEICDLDVSNLTVSGQTTMNNTTVSGTTTVNDLATFNGGVVITNPGGAGTLSVSGLSTFNGALSITGNVEIFSPGELSVDSITSVELLVDSITSDSLTVDTITSNVGQDMTISPDSGQTLTIAAAGGGQVNIATSGQISLGGKVKVALTQYDSDALAGAGGVLTGELYQTSGTGGSAPFNSQGIVMVKL
jgi:hypothetical protein